MVFHKIIGDPKPLDSLDLRRRQVSFSQTTFIWSSRPPGCDLSLGPIQPRKTAGRRNSAVRIRYSTRAYDGASAGIGEKRDQTAFGDILDHQQLGSPWDSHAAKDAGCARAEATSTSSRSGRWDRPIAGTRNIVQVPQLQPALPTFAVSAASRLGTLQYDEGANSACSIPARDLRSLGWFGVQRPHWCFPRLTNSKVGSICQ